MTHVTTLTPNMPINQKWHFFCFTPTMSPIKLLRQSTIDTLNSIDSLPTLPDLFLHIQSVLNAPESTLQDLTQAIERDQIIAATIVKIANSSYYNPMNKPASSLSFAISRLGRTETSNIALSMSLLYGFSLPTGIANMRRFWAHAFAVGQTCRKICFHLPKESQLNSEELFLSGLLHDIGRAILGIRIDPQYFEQSFANFIGEELIQAEQQTYGIDHAQVSAIVLKQWGFPAQFCQLIEQHHNSNNKHINAKILILADHITHQHLANLTNIEEVETKTREPEFDTVITQYLTKTNWTNT